MTRTAKDIRDELVECRVRRDMRGECADELLVRLIDWIDRATPDAPISVSRDAVTIQFTYLVSVLDEHAPGWRRAGEVQA